MSSKYDVYWRGKLAEISKLLQEAYEDGVSSKLDVSDIQEYGERQKWYGAVEISSGGIVKKNRLHAKSLGEVVHSSGLLEPYTGALFRMTISGSLRLMVKRLNFGEVKSKIEVSENTYERLLEFKRVVETVLEEKISLDCCAEMILILGIDHMLDDLFGSLDSAALLRSIQQLGAEHPAQVYRYIAETLGRGAVARGQEEMRQRLGFQKPAPRMPSR